MPERHLFLVATVMVPALLSFVQAQWGLLGTGLCGALVAVLIYTLWRQPYTIRQAVAQQTQALLDTQAALQQQLADQRCVHARLHMAKEAAEQANWGKSVFLLNVSNELRMPLNAIIGYSELLQEDIEELTDQSCLADVRQIHEASLHLRTLINDLLDLARIEAGTMAFCLETFDVAGLLQEIVATWQPLVQQHDNTLEVHITSQLGTMNADRAKLRKSLDSLFHHASTFTRQGTIVLHATRQTVNDRDWIMVCVRDTGPGISQEHTEDLLQDVMHSAATTRQYGGTGFGLALSLRLCRMMGGDITLTSVINEGSLYMLRMPVQATFPLALVPTLPVPDRLEEWQCTTPDLPGTLAGDTRDKTAPRSERVPVLL